MPKDKNLAKHKSRFEVRGGVINEYEYGLNEGAITEEEQERFSRQQQGADEDSVPEAAGSGSPQNQAERVQRLTEQARQKVARKKQKESGGGTAQGRAGAGATGAASKGAARKGAPAKGTASKGASGKGAAGKSTAAGKGTKGTSRKSVRAR